MHPPVSTHPKTTGGDDQHPLESIRNPVAPLVVALQHGHDDSNANFLSHTPAKVDVGREVSTHGYGADLGGVCDAQSLKDTPGLQGPSVPQIWLTHIRARRKAYNTAQNLGRQQGLDILRRKEERRPRNDEHETSNHCPSVSNTLRYPAVEQQADQFSHVGALVLLGSRRKGGKGAELTLLRPDCQGAVTCQSPPGSISPYLRLNWGKASLDYLSVRWQAETLSDRQRDPIREAKTITLVLGKVGTHKSC